MTLGEGKDLSAFSWITITDGQVTDVDFNQYIEHISRMKPTLAFDAVDLSKAENQLFGTEKIDKQHFTEFAFERDTVDGSMADEKMIKMMNPMNYIGTKNTDVPLACLWLE